MALLALPCLLLGTILALILMGDSCESFHWRDTPIELSALVCGWPFGQDPSTGNLYRYV